MLNFNISFLRSFICSFIFSVIFFLMTVFFITGSKAEMNQEKLTANATRITAQKMIYSKKSNQVEFLENVHVLRSDFQLWCKKLTVYLVKQAKSSPDSTTLKGTENFKKIVAEENVRLETQDRKARSSKAIYQSESGVLVLEGDAVLSEGKNTIKGQTVRLYLDENRSEVIGGAQGQVEAVFYSSQEGED